MMHGPTNKKKKSGFVLSNLLPSTVEAGERECIISNNIEMLKATYPSHIAGSDLKFREMSRV